MTTDTRGCCRVWRKHPETDNYDVHICALAVGHAGLEHRCGCGAIRTLNPPANQQRQGAA